MPRGSSTACDPDTIDPQAVVTDLGASPLAFVPWAMPAPGRIAAGIEMMSRLVSATRPRRSRSPSYKQSVWWWHIGTKIGASWAETRMLHRPRRLPRSRALQDVFDMTVAGGLNRRLVLEAPSEADGAAA